MRTKEIIKRFSQGLLLSLIMFTLWFIFLAIFSGIFGLTSESSDQENMLQFMAILLLICLINTSVIYYTILRSRWKGIKLISTITLQIFGIQFFLPLSEVLIFNNALNMPLNAVMSTLLSGLSMAIAFSFASAAILGMMREKNFAEVSNKRLQMPWHEFLIKFLVLAVITYPLLYSLAGYFIAWQFEAVRLFYTGSSEKLSFIKVVIQNFKESNLYLMQILRAALWIGIALPVIRMLKGKLWETVVVIGLLFALIMNSQHLIPNPYMPENIRLPHFIETASSNFIWGAAIALFMHRHHSSLTDFFLGSKIK